MPCGCIIFPILLGDRLVRVRGDDGYEYYDTVDNLIRYLRKNKDGGKS